MSENSKSTLAMVMLGVLALQKKKRKKRKHRVWCKNLSLNREKSSQASPMNSLKENDPDDFRNYLRMSGESFELLLNLVEPLIRKKETLMRQAISAEQRLVATLRFLATGRSLEDLKFSTGISAQSLGRIIPETCAAIVRVLQAEYLKFPSNSVEWKATAEEFNDLWNFPNCGGALGGRHIRIIPPAHSGSYYYNYKGFFSIILLAVVNAKYEFLYLDIGKNGSNSDGGVIDRNEFQRRLKTGNLHLPTNQETVEGLNFVFAADDAFALHEHILKPFPKRNITPEQKIFNYRLSRARSVVENAFGVMSYRFRVFHTAINLGMEKIDLIVECCCILHNFLRRTTVTYMPASSIDREDTMDGTFEPGEWRNDSEGLLNLAPARPRLPSASARQNRMNYAEYFVDRGAVSWQNDI